ncbi:hypothetical protein [Roseibium hamelinense]|uniref:hypothetical protein n=1 Tax=Roseibium hamelinense TaxID=150831 RepID=UPI0012BBF894|nr:hypothetical protein [Roseibium hamelinense]
MPFTFVFQQSACCPTFSPTTLPAIPVIVSKLETRITSRYRRQYYDIVKDRIA